MAASPDYSLYLSGLAKYVDEHFQETTAKIVALKEAGKISYSTLWNLFPESAKVYGFANDQVVGMIVQKHEYYGGFFPGLNVTGTGDFVLKETFLF